MAKKDVVALALIFLLIPTFLTACGGKREHLLSGKTMGTTYHIKVTAGRWTDMAKVQIKVDECLEQVNQSMSTFRPESEISRFNALNKAGQPFAVSTGFLEVMRVAQEIYRQTDGAWDGTVNPLVNLWGFGKKGPLQKVPAQTDIDTALGQVGFDRIQIDPKGYLIKKHADVTVDLASIAKGWGVDQVAAVLKGLGFTDYLVEIGGEVYAAGLRPDGTPWRVGINRPQADAPAEAVYKVVPLSNRAMATSGDYRNFYKVEEKIYSHIIDPRTGYPIQNGVVSASVVAPDCTQADGLATAMMVMGPEKGIALLDRLEGIEGLIIVRQADGSLQEYYSKGMKALIAS
ncbi:MAG: FAD:protein FMN transferase [Desulfobacteraceae bacterium]|nr:FAD:protein FMN transferase [Desulfobacteraceae bacterium]